MGAVAFDDGREAERGRGWIPLLAVAEPWRRRGYGVQLIGEAVMHYRPMGRDRLGVAAPESVGPPAVAEPPRLPVFSSTSTLAPASAAARAVFMPAKPQPMTMTSGD